MSSTPHGQGSLLPHRLAFVGRTRGGLARAVLGVAVSGVLVLGLACASAQAAVVHVGGQSYGVALRQAGSSALASPVAQLKAPQFAKGEAGPPLAYGGGPLMLSAKFYAIFWGPSGSFAPSYENSITQYLKGLQADSGKLTNDYSVITQYTDGTGAHITSNVSFVTSVDDTMAYPAVVAGSSCASDPNAGNPCVTDPQIRTEIQRLIAANGWETDPASAPVAEYLLFTPQNVDSCDSAGAGGSCTFSASGAYCGYHAEITNVNGGSNVAIYSNGPYQSGCDSGNAPGGVSGDVDADGALDTLVHELGESATDPAPSTGYTDSSGLEVGDKCQNGASNNDQPLGGSATASPPTLYNQVINGADYYTQTLWSNAPTQTPSSTAAAGCLQRLGPSPQFTPPTAVVAGDPQQFDGSTSYSASGAISSYTWSFGDGTPTASGATVSHTFAAGGTYTVTLTVSDTAGNATTQTAAVTVAPPNSQILTVTPAGTGTGTVTSSPTGINCGATCSASFPTSAQVTLTAAPATGSTFAGFSGGGCSGSATTCTVTLSSNQTVTATFNSTVPKSTLTVTPAGTGTGTVTSSPTAINCGATCSADFDSGTIVTLTAKPDPGDAFAGFSGGGCSGSATTCAVTLSSSQTVTATFTALPPPHVLTVTPAGTGTGTVTSNPTGINCGTTCSGNFNDGTIVTLTAVAANGSTFAGFSGGGCTGTGPCTVTLTSDTTITATFTATVVAAPTTLVANPYLLYLTPSATLRSNGKGVPGQLITFTANGKQICTATTNKQGFAKCSQWLAGFVMVVKAGGYHAAFAGTPTLTPSSANAGLFSITFGRRQARHGTRPRH
jgi:hypothetical protein